MRADRRNKRVANEAVIGAAKVVCWRDALLGKKYA